MVTVEAAIAIGSLVAVLAVVLAAVGAVVAQVRCVDAAGEAARRASRDDAAGAQAAYDSVMRTACTQAAVAGPGKYPARCDAVLHPTPTQAAIGSCDADPDAPAVVTECND